MPNTEENKSATSKSASSDFLRLDFTIDLICHEKPVSGAQDSGVLCKFQLIHSLARDDGSFEERKSPKQDTAINKPTYPMPSRSAFIEMNTPEPRSAIPDPESFSPIRSSLNDLHSKGEKDSGSDIFMSSTRPLQNLIYQSRPLSQSVDAPGGYSLPVQQGEAVPSSMAPVTNPRLANHPELSDIYFPSRVVLAQQMQIDSLSREVEELKALVEALRGSLISNVNTQRSTDGRDFQERIVEQNPPGNDQNVLRSSMRIGNAIEQNSLSQIRLSTALDEKTNSESIGHQTLQSSSLQQESNHTAKSPESVNSQKQFKDHEKFTAFYEETEVCACIYSVYIVQSNCSLVVVNIGYRVSILAVVSSF